MFLSVLRRWIVSTTSDESMMEPSTMASGESCSIPSFNSWNVPPFFSFSSTSLTADEPISRPTTFLLFEKNTAHPFNPTHFSGWHPVVGSGSKLQRLNFEVNSTGNRVMNRLRDFDALSLPGVARNRPRRYNLPLSRYLRS